MRMPGTCSQQQSQLTYATRPNGAAAWHNRERAEKVDGGRRAIAAGGVTAGRLDAMRSEGG